MRYVSVVLALVAVLAVAGCGGRQAAEQLPTQPAQPGAVAPPAGQTVQVKMTEFKFEMSPAELKTGKVTFEVENAGSVEHSFVIEEIGVKSEHIQPGQKVTITADVKPGTYPIICDVAGHKEAGMQTQLIVK